MIDRLSIILAIFLFLGLNDLPAQLQDHGFGVKFASNINYHPRAREYRLVEAGYTTAMLGVYYGRYTEFSGFEVGFNVQHKAGERGGFNLPGVMTDFSDDQNVGVTSVEMDFKVGPRFLKVLYPKLGYVLGYRLHASGFQTPGNNQEIERWYFHLPFGLATHLPTQWGAVGAGVHYYIGLVNVIKNPDPDNIRNYDGGRLRAINIELTVTFGLPK